MNIFCSFEDALLMSMIYKSDFLKLKKMKYLCEKIKMEVIMISCLK